MTGRQRLRIIALVAFSLFIVFCFAGIILPEDHDCSGDNCFICSLADSTMQLIFISAALFLFSHGLIPILSREAFRRLVFLKASDPVRSKVKLSD